MTRVLIAMLLLLAPATLAAQEPKAKPPAKNSFMEKKLSAARKLLGGLALNDFATIKENAETLNDFSKQAAWKLIETPRYEVYSEEFHRVTLKMAKAAGEKNLDGAALAYVDMTLTCVKCHQHVREQKIGMSRFNNLNGSVGK